jgi:hypothetical protein
MKNLQGYIINLEETKKSLNLFMEDIVMSVQIKTEEKVRALINQLFTCNSTDYNIKCECVKVVPRGLTFEVFVDLSKDNNTLPNILSISE